MKATRFPFIVLFLMLCIQVVRAQGPGCPIITPVASQPVICAGQCTNLTATVQANYTTNSYSVQSTPYAPYPYTGGTQVSINVDDVWSGVIPLGFNFCFFGNVYSTARIGSNGVLSFSNPGSSVNGYTQVSPLPSTANGSSGFPSGPGFPPSSIGLYRDINPGAGANKRIAYYTTGTAPCRVMVIYFSQVPLFNCNTPESSFQILLYENTNYVEIHVGNSTSCPGWQGGKGILGMQNAIPNVAVCPAGYNSTPFTAVNQAFRFTPTGASSYAVTWSSPSGTIATGNGTAGLGPVSVCPTANTTYTAVMRIANCDGIIITYSNTVNVVVNPKPPVSATAVSPVCAGQALSLGASGAGTYTWTGPNTFSTTAQNPTITPAGTAASGVYSVTGTSLGCSATATVAATVNPNPTVTVGSNSPLCSNSSLSLTAGGATTYTWSGPNSFTSTAQNPSINPATTAAGGVYTVTGTSLGCTSFTTVNVTVNVSPVISPGSDSPVCNGSSLNLTAGGATTYTWSGPNSFTSTAQNPSINPASTAASGIYTVSGTDLGCTGSATVNVTVNPLPVIGPGSNSPVCSGNSLNLTAGGATTFTWSGPNSFTSTAQNPSINPATPAASGIYTVSGTSLGCTSFTTVNITVNAPPVISPGSDSPVCNGSPLHLTAGGATTYTWSGPNSFTSTVQNPSINPVSTAASGVYTVTGTDLGCIASATVGVTINPSPVISPGSNSPVCSGDLLNLTAAGATTFTWSGPNSFTSTLQNPSINPATTAAGGIYTVTGTSLGCAGTNTVSVTVNPIPAVTIGSNAPLCAGGTLVLNAGGGAGYAWSGPASFGSALQNPTITPAASANAGVYTVTATTAAGCSHTATVSVTVNSATTPTIGTPAVLNCTNTTTGLNSMPAGLSYTWTGSGLTAGVNSANASANQAGSYTLSVTDAAGCIGTATTTVTQNTVGPTVTVTPTTRTITCASSSVTLNGSATPASFAANWLGGVCGGASTHTATACSPGIYTLVATNPANGCTALATATVYADSSIPVVSVTNSGSVTCVSSTVQVVATTTTTPVSYSWTGPGTIASPSASATTVDAGGVYQCVVSDLLSGCATTITTNVPVNTSPVSASVSPAGTITCAVPAEILHASPTGSNYTYSWTGSGITGNTAATPTVNLAGLKTVVVTNTVNGCTGTASITVQADITPPVVSVTPQSYTNTCGHHTVQLTASATTTDVSYTWTPPGSGSLSDPSIANPVASGSGVFTVVATNTVNGCASAPVAATLSVNNAAPSLSLSATSLSLSCNTATAGVVASSTSPAVTYSWNPSPFSGGSSGTPVFDAAGVYTLTLSDNGNGCNTTGTLSVTSDTNAPTVSTAVSQTLSCTNHTVSVTSTVTASGSVSYAWSGPGISGSTTGAAIDATQPGTYTLQVSDLQNGCNSQAVETVAADMTVPTASISGSGPISCNNPSVNLVAGSNAGAAASYTWLPGGSTGSGLTVSAAGTYTVIVLNTVNGCTVVALTSIVANTVSPQVSASNTLIPCHSSSIYLEATSTPTNVSYSWTTANGAILGGAATASPQVGSAGTYSVTVTDPSNGCVGSGTVSVTQNSVSAAFDASPSSGSSPLTVGFTNQSSGAGSYSWDFGNGSGSTSSDPSTLYASEGTYTVMLIAQNGSCEDTAFAVIVVEADFAVEIPNVFTPNNDQVNDVFKVRSSGVKSLTIYIANRWGERVYEAEGLNAAWDGMSPDGKGAVDGTYFYIVKATGLNGKTIEKQGTLSLFR